MEIVGRILLLAIGALLVFAYPLTEIARGMASNASQHPRSRTAMALTAVGFALLTLAITA